MTPDLDSRIEDLLARSSTAMTLEALEKRTSLTLQELMHALNRGIAYGRISCTRGKFGQLWYGLRPETRKRWKQKQMKEAGKLKTVACVLQQAERPLTPYQIKTFMPRYTLMSAIVRELEALTKKGYVLCHDHQPPLTYEWRKAA